MHDASSSSLDGCLKENNKNLIVQGEELSRKSRGQVIDQKPEVKS